MKNTEQHSHKRQATRVLKNVTLYSFSKQLIHELLRKDNRKDHSVPRMKHKRKQNTSDPLTISSSSSSSKKRKSLENMAKWGRNSSSSAVRFMYENECMSMINSFKPTYMCIYMNLYVLYCRIMKLPYWPCFMIFQTMTTLKLRQWKVRSSYYQHRRHHFDICSS